jgi:hypothetical protein
MAEIVNRYEINSYGSTQAEAHLGRAIVKPCEAYWDKDAALRDEVEVARFGQCAIGHDVAFGKPDTLLDSCSTGKTDFA